MAWLREADRWFLAAVLPHRAVFRAYARRLVGDESEADDLVQEAYGRVLGCDWRRLEAPERFVLRVIRNLAVERFRKARVVSIRQIDALDPEAIADDAPDPESRLAARDDLRHAIRALGALPPQCRRVLILRKLQGLSPGEIAVRLGLSVSTVEKHLAKGLRLLTEERAQRDGAQAEISSAKWVRGAQKVGRS
ncbi:MAG: RNA polymerase sigma factor [Phenylobacterium sp.]|uniref:RNA polymerase sigma factor n=1 Tax=Phenylobacterium sp. TaxID=1871053 RepID=UPI00391C8C0D